MEFYCPSCGYWSMYDDFASIAPGFEIEVICENCGTKWRIKIEFEEVEEE